MFLETDSEHNGWQWACPLMEAISLYNLFLVSESADLTRILKKKYHFHCSPSLPESTPTHSPPIISYLAKPTGPHRKLKLCRFKIHRHSKVLIYDIEHDVKVEQVINSVDGFHIKVREKPVTIFCQTNWLKNVVRLMWTLVIKSIKTRNT